MKTVVEDILSTLVSMPTISDDCTANEMALDYIEQFLATRGMHTRRYQFDGHGALVASSRSNNAKTAKVLLAAHVDVAPGSEKVFTLRLEDKRLMGRGVYDMKQAIASYMQLVDDLRDDLANYNFAIMITTDEEYGGVDNINGVDKLVKLGYHPQVCILPDSAAPNWEIEAWAKGYWRFDLMAKGRTTHGSRPWEGESASLKIIQALHAIREQFKNHGPSTDTLNVGIIRGGVAFNLIPSEMIASIEIRLASDESLVKNRYLMSKICKEYDVSLKTRICEPPLKSDFDHPAVQRFADSIERVTGKRPRGSTSYAASDAVFFKNIGVPYVITCPEGGKHHSEDEWVDRESFLQFVPILHDFFAHNAIDNATPVDTKQYTHV